MEYAMATVTLGILSFIILCLNVPRFRQRASRIARRIYVACMRLLVYLSAFGTLVCGIVLIIAMMLIEDEL